jgi:cytochrome c oxidase assembly protein subunit 11
VPAKAGIYFNKIQCFCFEEQRLKGNESVELPILFFIDPNFSKDPKMKDIDSLVLSYSFYQTS